MIKSWKRYLQSKGLYNSDIYSDVVNEEFKSGMRNLEGMLTEKIPSIKGMIWQGGLPNPNASIDDVESALCLISKYGVATLDDLGSPGEDKRSGIFDAMFVSKDDSGIDSYTPNNQNPGKWLDEISVKNKKINERNYDIDKRMKELSELVKEK